MVKYLISAIAILLAVMIEPAQAQYANVVPSCPVTRTTPYTQALPSVDINGIVVPPALIQPTFDVNGNMCVNVAPYPFTPIGAEQHNLGVVSATSLTVPSGALFARVCVSGNNVKWRADGTAPTATIGNPTLQGQCEFFTAAFVSVVQFIQVAATATLDVVYSK